MIRLITSSTSTGDAAKRLGWNVPVEGWTPHQVQRLLDDVCAQHPDLSIDATWRPFSDYPEAGRASLEIRSETITGHYEIELQPRLHDGALGYEVAVYGQFYSTFLIPEEVLEPVPYLDDGELSLNCPTPQDAVWACHQLIESGADEWNALVAERLQVQVYARSGTIAAQDSAFVAALDQDMGSFDSPKAHMYARSAAAAAGDVAFLNAHGDQSTPGEGNNPSEADEARAAAAGVQQLHSSPSLGAPATHRPHISAQAADNSRGFHR